jgi:hypothetical protein
LGQLHFGLVERFGLESLSFERFGLPFGLVERVGLESLPSGPFGLPFFVLPSGGRLEELFCDCL